MRLKRFAAAAAAIILIGAGCDKAPKAEPAVEPSPQAVAPQPAGLTSPSAAVPAEPAEPAVPSQETGTTAQPAQPAEPATPAQPTTPPPAAPPTTPAAIAPKKVSVSYTGSAFSPAQISVKKGDTVVWTNTGSGMLWVASNPHPVHTGYPGFDEGGSISTGATWSFTFDKTGTWGYHNHFNPGAGGTVTVGE